MVAIVADALGEEPVVMLIMPQTSLPVTVTPDGVVPAPAPAAIVVVPSEFEIT